MWCLVLTWLQRVASARPASLDLCSHGTDSAPARLAVRRSGLQSSNTSVRSARPWLSTPPTESEHNCTAQGVEATCGARHMMLEQQECFCFLLFTVHCLPFTVYICWIILDCIHWIIQVDSELSETQMKEFFVARNSNSNELRINSLLVPYLAVHIKSVGSL
jgi:hypothetical protein